MIGVPIKTELFDRDGTSFVRLTYTCMWCNQPNAVEVLHQEYRDWLEKGMLIQNAFPNTSAADREVLMTGSHAKCFDEGMKEPEEEEDHPECAHYDVECDDVQCPCLCDDCPADEDIES